jgi:anaerobic magnesium-protoporphyrin IX monomethyl ester cyclase
MPGNKQAFLHSQNKKIIRNGWPLYRPFLFQKSSSDYFLSVCRLQTNKDEIGICADIINPATINVFFYFVILRIYSVQMNKRFVYHQRVQKSANTTSLKYLAEPCSKRPTSFFPKKESMRLKTTTFYEQYYLSIRIRIFIFISSYKMPNRKKIILFDPISDSSMPLALLAIASVVDQSKYEVVIIDCTLNNNYENIINKDSKNILCVGITVLTGKPIKKALNFSKMVKDISSDIPVIWGGWHTSMFLTELLENHEDIDITVQAQGEETFKELVYHIDNNISLKEIKGITYRHNGQIIKTPPRSLVSMEALPMVNYDLIDINKHFELKGERSFEFVSSIGCFFRCTFCADPFVFNRKYSALPGKNLGKQIKYYQEKYNFTKVNFMDETFFTHEKRVKEFAQYIIENNVNITWKATMRADQGKRLSEEAWLLAKKSGLESCGIGIESGSQKILDWLQKDTKLEEIYFTTKKCKSLDIAADLTFIVGFPGEEIEDVRATFKLILELKEMSPKFTVWLFYYKPFPGSVILNKISEMGFKIPTTTVEWAEYDMYGKLGPWVSKNSAREIMSFSYYNSLVFGKNQQKTASRFLRWIGNWRLKKSFYFLPFEKFLLGKTEKKFTSQKY